MVKQFLLELDERLHARFKAKCAANGQSMKAAFTDFMKWYVSRRDKKAKRKPEYKRITKEYNLPN